MHKTSPSLQWIFTGLPPFSEGALEQPALVGNFGIIVGILGERKAYHGKTATILEQVSNEKP